MLVDPENSPFPHEHTSEALNFLKTAVALCDDNVDTWLYKVRCVSGTFNELGDPAGCTMPLTFPTSALLFGATQYSTQLKFLEMSLALELF